MDLSSITELMRVQVLGAVGARVFASARSECAALATFEDVPALLALMRSRAESTWKQRDDLTRVIIGQHRASKGQLWSQMLYVLYYPLLRSIRSKLNGGRLSSDDLDQIVVLSFATTLQKLNVPAYRNISMGLQQYTRRAVFECLGHEFKHEQSVLSGEEIAARRGPNMYGDWPSSNNLNSKEDVFRLGNDRAQAMHNTDEERASDSLSLSSFMRFAGQSGINPDALRVLEITQHETLREYCVRTGADERGYQRMKKQRSRAMRRLRSMAATIEE